MRAILFLLAVLVGGCASAPEQKSVPPAPVVPTPVINEQCRQVAVYARAIAHLRIIGVGRADLQLFVSTPVATTFPQQYIQHDVYSRNDGIIETTNRYYQLCTDYGYENLLITLKIEDQKRSQQKREEERKQQAPEIVKPMPTPPKKKPAATRKPVLNRPS